MKWPRDPSKYVIIPKVVDFKSDKIFRFTLWQTDIKNIHFTFWALGYAKNSTSVRGKEYYKRGRHFLNSIGLLNDKGALSREGTFFLNKCFLYEKEDPGYFNDDVNPFELEKDLYEIALRAGNREYRDNIDVILRYASNFNVDDIGEIITLQRIYNSKTSIVNYFSLDKKARFLLTKELENLTKDFMSGGRFNKLKNNCMVGWDNFLVAFSKGMLGFQNDGYYRGQNFIKCRILELVEELVRKAPYTFDINGLYKFHKTYISKSSFNDLVKQSVVLGVKDGLFFMKETIIKQLAQQEIIEDSESTLQATKVVHSELLGLTEQEKIKELEKKLAELEKIAAIQRGKKTDIKVTTSKQNRRCRRAGALLLERLDYTCQICRYTFEKEYGVRWNVVHHVDPIRTIQDNRPSNLLVVDPNCHAMIECGRIEIKKIGDFLLIKNIFTNKTKKIKQNKF